MGKSYLTPPRKPWFGKGWKHIWLGPLTIGGSFIWTGDGILHGRYPDSYKRVTVYYRWWHIFRGSTTFWKLVEDNIYPVQVVHADMQYCWWGMVSEFSQDLVFLCHVVCRLNRLFGTTPLWLSLTHIFRWKFKATSPKVGELCRKKTANLDRLKLCPWGPPWFPPKSITCKWPNRGLHWNPMPSGA